MTMPCKTNTARAELVRLASFSKWPMEPYTMMQVSLVRLAAAGFLYTGDSDGIVCSYCDAVVRGWLGTSQSPDVEHSCTSNRAARRADTPQRDVRAPSATAPSYVEAAGRSRPTVPEAGTLLRSGNVAGRDSASAADRNNDVSTRQLEGDGVRRAAACVASSSSSRHGVDNVAAHSTSGDVRDSAAANLNDEEQQLMEENRRLHEAKTCKVCMDKDVNTVFLPCGHLVSCDQCSPKLRNCPVCRTYIRGTVKSIIP